MTDQLFQEPEDIEEARENIIAYCSGKVVEYVEKVRHDKSSKMNEIIQEIKLLETEKVEPIEFYIFLRKMADDKLIEYKDDDVEKAACWGEVRQEARMRVEHLKGKEIPEHIKDRRKAWGEEYIEWGENDE